MEKLWRSPHDQQSHSAAKKRNALIIAIFLTLLAFSIQIVGAYISKSIALLSDTAHLFADIFSLLMSLFSVILSARKPSEQRSFGLFRLEVLASFCNGLLLFFVAIGIAWEAVERILHPPSDISPIPLLIVAAAGLALNLSSAFFLQRAMRVEGLHHDHGHGHDHHHEHHHHEHHADHNLRAAMLHVMSDALGSFAVIVGGVIIYYTHLFIVDGVIGFLISALVLFWAVRLLKDTAHVLLESTPKHIQTPALVAALKKQESKVNAVEDLHIWEITARMYALSAFIVVSEMPLSEADALRARIESFLEKQYGIAHATIAFKKG